MTVMRLMDNLDNGVCYGLLMCGNDKVSKEDIQNKIYEIKNKLYENNEDWIIDDVVNGFPQEWRIYLQEQSGQVEI